MKAKSSELISRKTVVRVLGVTVLGMGLMIGVSSAFGATTVSEESSATSQVAEASLPVADHGLDLNSIPPRINDDGLVYGTVDQAEAPGGQVDLVAVVATNGREGYVYFDAFQEAAGMNATSPDEAVQYMENAEAASNRALAEQLTRLLPEGVEVTVEQATQYLDTVVRAAIPDPFDEGLASVCQQGLADLAQATGLPETDVQAVLDDAYLAAQDQVSTHIPVYESDGKTQIGEFAVGSLV